MAKKTKPDSSLVPCMRVMIGAPKGASGTQDDRKCPVVGTGPSKGYKFDMRRSYQATSKTVDAVEGRHCGEKKDKQGNVLRYKKTGAPMYKKCPPPCNNPGRKGCPVQLAFDRGQPFLRFCRAKGKPGFRQDINTTAEATSVAAAACAHWAKRKNFERFFAKGTPLKGARPRRK